MIESRPARHKYHEAYLIGDQREEAIKKVREGIACFKSLEEALLDAEENIRLHTKSDFTTARFYEVVKSEVQMMMVAHAKSDFKILKSLRDLVQVVECGDDF